MRGWPAMLVVAAVVLTLPLLVVGCKGQATQTADVEKPSEPEAESPEDQEGHEHEGDEAAEGAGPSAEATLEGLRSEDDRTVVGALEGIQQMKSATQLAQVREAVRELIVAKGTSAEVKTIAVTTWGRWASEEPAPLLAAADSPHATVRAAVAGTLRTVDSDEAKALLTKLKDDADGTVRATAAEVLGEKLRSTQTQAAIDTLVADLGNPDGDRSAQAGMQLEQRGRTDRAVVAKLITTLRTSPNPAQRHSCATILALTCAGTSPGQKKFASSVKAVYRLERNPAPAYEAGLPALVEALERDPEPMVREAAAFGLGMIGSEEAAPALGRALQDPDEHVRRRAAAALVIVPPTPVEKQLINAAKDDPSPSVRRFAVEAMTNLEGNRAGDAVMLCLLDPDPEVRRYACEVLRRIGTRRQTQALVNLFEDPDDEVRWKAVEAVAQFADPEAKGALIKALNDPSPRVALAAERGVHRLGIGARVLTKAERTAPRRPEAASG